MLKYSNWLKNSKTNSEYSFSFHWLVCPFCTLVTMAYCTLKWKINGLKPLDIPRKIPNLHEFRNFSDKIVCLFFKYPICLFLIEAFIFKWILLQTTFPPQRLSSEYASCALFSQEAVPICL